MSIDRIPSAPDHIVADWFSTVQSSEDGRSGWEYAAIGTPEVGGSGHTGARLGRGRVIMHCAGPDELDPIMAAYRAVESEQIFAAR